MGSTPLSATISTVYKSTIEQRNDQQMTAFADCSVSPVLDEEYTDARRTMGARGQTGAQPQSQNGRWHPRLPRSKRKLELYSRFIRGYPADCPIFVFQDGRHMIPG